MPIIKITQADKMKAKPLEPGWYPATIDRIDVGPGKKDPRSITYTFQFRTEDGHEIPTWVSSKMTDKFIPIAMACGVNLKDHGDDEIDVDQLVGKKCQISIVYNDNGKGNIINGIDGFAALGVDKSAAATPF